MEARRSDGGTPPVECPPGLGAGVVELLYEQVFAPGRLSTEREVCRAFAGLLLDNSELCCVAVYLRGEGGDLSEGAVVAREGTDEAALGRAAGWAARESVRAGGELEVRPGGDDEGSPLAGAGVGAGVALPARARGEHVATLVALADRPGRLGAALESVRFAAAPLVTSLGAARRAARMGEQQAQIGRLVEELRERGAALAEANGELREVALYRSVLLARMSHELRTPLTAILGFAELLLLEGEPLTETQRRYCERIQSSGRYLQATVKHLVDLSRLEAGKTEPFLHEFSPRETLRESCEAVSGLACKRDVTLDCQTAPDCGHLVSDEGQLRQIFYNLLAHAVARSPAGGTVRVRATAPDAARLRFEIEDDGEPHGDPAGLHESPGCEHAAGKCADTEELGLAIARRLVLLLGGTVEFDAGETRGLTVRLEFPTAPHPPGAGA